MTSSGRTSSLRTRVGSCAPTSRPHRFRSELRAPHHDRSDAPRSTLRSITARSVLGRAGRGGRRAAPGSSAGSRARRRPTRACMREQAARRRADCPPPPRRCAPVVSAGTSPQSRRPAPRTPRPSRGSSVIRMAFAFGVHQAAPRFEEVRSGACRAESTGACGEGRDVLDQIEQRRLGPVDVLEARRSADARVRAPRTACALPQAISSGEAAPPPPSAAPIRSAGELVIGVRARPHSPICSRSPRAAST